MRCAGPFYRATTSLFANPVSGQIQSFSLKFPHPRGFGHLGVVNTLINEYLNGDSACSVAFSQPLGVFYLVNDLGPGNGVSSATSAGTNLTLVLGISL